MHTEIDIQREENRDKASKNNPTFTSQMQAIRDRKEKERQEAIDKLVEKGKASGGITDRLYWKMVYDFEMAPKTTNRKQLLELGIEMPPFDEVGHPIKAHVLLKVVLQGLALHNIYVLQHEHLNDEDFYKVIYKCLDEDCREVPNEPGVREYIHLMGEPCSGDSMHERDWVPVAPPYKDTQ